MTLIIIFYHNTILTVQIILPIEVKIEDVLNQRHGDQ